MPPAHAQPTFAARVIAWQQRHGRHDLPWQGTADPYRIWLSEIMLQQTQVSAVIPYYRRFLERFPTVEALARADAETVAEYWAGLGYYARARNLHRCARQVVAERNGAFPTRAAELATLPGIGRSTAAAIAAFASGERAAILDGNVKRVLCRSFGIEGFPGQRSVEQDLWRLAESLLPATDMAAYTQGLMDLGATLCTRSRPRCPNCPLAADCVAHRHDRQQELPAARPRPPVPDRHGSFLLISDGTHILLQRRPPTGIWGGLLVPPEGAPGPLLSALGLAPAACRELPGLQHRFTHFRLTIAPLLFRVADRPPATHAPGWEWLPLDRVERAALPPPFRRLLRHLPPPDPGAANQTGCQRIALMPQAENSAAPTIRP